MKRTLLPNERGSALVEFAFATPILLLILVGLIEVTRFAYFCILVGNAAHAGAAYGAQTLATANDTTGMQNAAKNDGQNVPQLSVTSAGAVCGCWNGTASTAQACTTTTCAVGHRVIYAQVTVQGTVTHLFAYAGLPSTYTITRQAVIRVQQ
ncbi:MAG: pilus assembly protein [Candidatus Eremiobacteraeota bacterium]|nr:pilus assembly protein [Candidatus Eremiobacteraeota bacterium]